MQCHSNGTTTCHKISWYLRNISFSEHFAYYWVPNNWGVGIVGGLEK